MLIIDFSFHILAKTKYLFKKAINQTIMSNIKIKIAETDEELDLAQDMGTYAFMPSPVGERRRRCRGAR